MSSERNSIDDASGPQQADPAYAIGRALVVAVLLAVIGIAAGAVLVVAAAVVLGLAGVAVTPLLSIVLSLALATGLGFGGVAIGYLRYRGQGLEYVGVTIPSLREVAFTVAGYVGALALLIFASVIISTVGAEAAPNTAAEVGMENPEILLLLVPASFLLIGPGEELLYRGVVQNRLSEALPAPVAIVLASLLFASIHFFSLSGAPEARLVSISVLVLPTLVFGTMYELTKNLVVPALIHGAYNATLFSLLYLTLQYAEPGQLPQTLLAVL
ncbi:CPBP family intramembrane metalloprotease [Halobellus sp. Atlit-31R]|nr:CPBP family intramembrane metalloprotease [Halobellus sp. Atlit-31R]